MGTSGISECRSLVANTLQEHRWFFKYQNVSRNWDATHYHARSLKKIDIIIVVGNEKGFAWGDKPHITPIVGKKFFYPETYQPPLDRTY